MKIYLSDHTLCFSTKNIIYMLRPCLSLDGRLSNGKHIFPRCGKTIWKNSDRFLWTAYIVPYFIFMTCEDKFPVDNNH